MSANHSFQLPTIQKPVRARARILVPLVALWVVASFAVPAATSSTPERARSSDDPQSPAVYTLDTLYIAPRIVVEANRVDPRTEVLNRSGFVGLVDLDHRRARVEDLSSVLSQLVGVRVRQYGGLGSFATVSIRGSSSNQVTVFLDGIPVNDAYTGMTNLSDLPLGGVQRIEVYRGFGPPHLGTSAIGGAINLVTRNDTPDAGRFVQRLELNSSYGSFATSRQQASIWAAALRLKLFVHGGYRESQGNFSFVDDDGTPFNSSDDVTAKRINNAFYGGNVLGRLHWDVPGFGEAVLSHDAMARTHGVPGKGNFQSESARSERRRHITHVRLDPRLPERLGASVIGFYSTSNEKFSDRDASVSLMPQDSDNTITSQGGRARAKWFVPHTPLALEAVFESRKERFHPATNVPAPEEGPNRLRRSNTTVVSGDLYLLAQTVIVTAAQRFEHHINEFYDDPPFPWLPPSPQGKVKHRERTPSFGARWHATSFAVVKGNWGEYYRLPTFLEMFGNVGSITGNADLEPERGYNRDVGVTLTFDHVGPMQNVFLETVYLDNNVDNLILFFPNSQFTSQPTNIGSASISGWEVSFSTVVAGRLQVGGNYARLDTEDTSDIPYYTGNQLPSRPENELSVALSLPWKWWTATYELHHIGANYLDRANMQSVPARDLHNVVLRLRTPIEALSFTLEGRNLTDDQVSDVGGFPLPGRTFYSTASLQVK